ncbi:unnamed protein product [Jaminaea pallidilutea]
MRIATLLAASAAIASLALAVPPNWTPQARQELRSFSKAQKRDLAEGLLYVRAVNDGLVARGEPPLNEELARGIFELHLGTSKRSNPSGDYAPTTVQNCPAAPSNPAGGGTGYVRNATSQQANSQEADYVNRHRMGKQQDWRTWLSSDSPGPNLNITGGVENYTNTLSNIPSVGIAVSGGGYRAMLYGGGVVSGWDNRNSTSNERGLGGVLQRADYFSGLSGGSWMTGAFAINDWPTAQTLVDEVFDLGNNLVLPSDGTVSFYIDLVRDVSDKRDVDYARTSITDYWGRALSYHLLNDTRYPDEGQATTFSDIVNVTAFQDATYPFPIVVADARDEGEIIIASNDSIYEFTPYEFGTWNGVQAFFPTRLLGSNVTNGDMNRCVEGYDNFGWVVGTSATLFNGLFIQLVQSNGTSIIKDALTAIAGAVDDQNNDISQVPNPFRNYVNGVNSTISQYDYIDLVDGGLNNQNVPLQPLLQPARNVDFILALDSSADVSSWPNGSALYQTHLRAVNSGDQFNYIATPYFPSPNTFVNRGLNTRPTFFGCDASNATHADTAANNHPAPIVAYIPNFPYQHLTNFSTYKLDYEHDEAQSMLDNGVDVATLGGNNATWSQCLACGMLERSWARSGVQRPSECDACMQTYCWDGVENNTAPDLAYSPPVGMPQWVQNTATQQEPPYTGGDGSTTALGTGDGNGGGNGSGRTVSLTTTLPTIVLAFGFVLLSV